MIIMQDDGRYYATYTRTNRRVQWRYADWAGRWHSPDEAIEHVREKAHGERTEYRIESMNDDSVIQGFVN